jgi:hypothetical protein
MSSVVTGREIGRVLVSVVDFAVFLGGRVVDGDGLTLAATSDARVCTITSPRPRGRRKLSLDVLLQSLLAAIAHQTGLWSLSRTWSGQ